MFCSQCGSQNRDEAKFCKMCGAKLEMPQTVSHATATAPSAVPSTSQVVPASAVTTAPSSVPDPAPAAESVPKADPTPPVVPAPSQEVVPTSAEPTLSSAEPEAERVVRESPQDLKARILCITCGPLYSIAALCLLQQDKAKDNLLFLLLLLAYGVWLTVGFFTRGWRLVIY